MPVLVKSESVLPSSLSSSVALPDDSPAGIARFVWCCQQYSWEIWGRNEPIWVAFSCWTEENKRLSDYLILIGYKAICCCVVPPVPNLSYLYFNAIHKSHLIAYYIVSKTYICAYNRRAGKIISKQYCLGQKYGILFGNHHRTFFIT